jgi:hypothetical protein
VPGSNAYAMHPAIIGRRVEVMATGQVRVIYDGRIAPDHERIWAWHQTIFGPPNISQRPRPAPPAMTHTLTEASGRLIGVAERTAHCRWLRQQVKRASACRAPPGSLPWPWADSAVGEAEHV